jgi:hypothetical protein
MADLEVRNTMLQRANKTIQKLKHHVQKLEMFRKQHSNTKNEGQGMSRAQKETQTEDKKCHNDPSTTFVSPLMRASNTYHNSASAKERGHVDVHSVRLPPPLPGALPPEGNSVFIEGLYGPPGDNFDIPDLENESFYDPCPNDTTQLHHSVTPSDPDVCFVPPKPVQRPLPSTPPPSVPAQVEVIPSRSPSPEYKTPMKPKWLPNPAEVFDDVEFSPFTKTLRIRQEGTEEKQVTETKISTPCRSIAELNVKWKDLLARHGVTTPPKKPLLPDSGFTKSLYYTPGKI